MKNPVRHADEGFTYASPCVHISASGRPARNSSQWKVECFSREVGEIPRELAGEVWWSSPRRSSPPPRSAAAALAALGLIDCGAMHPKLTLHNNQRCVAEIEAFKKCHEAGYWARLLGECNAQKRDLDLCLRAQKKVKRGAQLVQAREDRERFHKVCEEIDRSERSRRADED